MSERILSGNYDADIGLLDGDLRVGRSFDIIRRDMKLSCGSRCTMYYIDGFVKDMVTQKLMEFILSVKSVEELRYNLPYVEVSFTKNIDELISMVLSGATAFLADGLSEAAVIDTRSYPTRSISEPENDRVLRGPRDGFTETLVFNTALIRRRIRDPNLTMSLRRVGDMTKTDVVVCYVKGRADDKFVSKILRQIEGIKIGALNMGQESLAECLIKQRWYNPFPKIRYTERPDSACAMLMEGSVIVICDNNPSVMILPTSIFDFLQETDDFYFPPLVGSYLKILRILVFGVTLFLTPLWYLLITHIQSLPPWLEFIKLSNEPKIPVLLQLFIIELAVDGLKMASLNTPNMLNNSLSVVGGLILGDFAVDIGWLIPEVIVYMAFVSISNFAQSSYELGYAFKFMRMFLLILTAIFGLFGFIGGLILIPLLIAANKTVDGSRSYLYPLIPWNGRAMKRLLLRVRLK